MRTALQQANGKRTVFFGTVARFGSKPGYKGRPGVPTLMLSDVKDRSGRITCDHLWFIFTKGFQKLEPDYGDRLMFDARVRQYRKGHRRDDEGLTVDYKLANPTNVRVIRRAKSTMPTVQPMLFPKSELAEWERV